MDSWPHAVSSTSASWRPADVSSTQRDRPSSNAAPVTSVRSRTLSSTPWLRATSSMYSLISCPGEKRRDQSGLGANENS